MDMHLTALEPRLVTPFTAMMAGPTGCGKTRALVALLNAADVKFTTLPVEIFLCYGEDQDAYDDIVNNKHLIPVIKHKGLISAEDLFVPDGQHRLVIIDDLMDQTKGTSIVEDLFTKQSHHLNLSVIFITQNLFYKGNRTISVNSHYGFLFKNPRDGQSIQNFAKQAYPGNTKYMTDSYADATTQPHSFLLVDMTQQASGNMRLLGQFLTPGKYVTTYLPV